MIITALMENTCSTGALEVEHGLSLYLETTEHKILFDMGKSPVFARNAEKLGIDLSAVDIAILSHGHYDHGGGLRTFLEINQKAPVYISRYAFEPHYHGPEKYIGLDTSLLDDRMAHYRERFFFTDDVTVIDTGLTLYSCNKKSGTQNSLDSELLMLKNDKFLTDDFRHEQYLLLEENNKRILISGCSHKGILDLVRWFKPDVLVGGFHFFRLPLDETLAGYARQLNESHTEFYTGHCTGTAQFDFMKKYMDRLHYLSTWESIRI